MSYGDRSTSLLKRSGVLKSMKSLADPFLYRLNSSLKRSWTPSDGPSAIIILVAGRLVKSSTFT